MTTPKTEWRDEHGRVLRRRYPSHAQGSFIFERNGNADVALSPTDARFLLRVLPEAVGIEKTAPSLLMKEQALRHAREGVLHDAGQWLASADDAAIVEAAEKWADSRGDDNDSQAALLNAIRAKRSALNK